jgi:hypothetical protein
MLTGPKVKPCILGFCMRYKNCLIMIVAIAYE